MSTKSTAYNQTKNDHFFFILNGICNFYCLKSDEKLNLEFFKFLYTINKKKKKTVKLSLFGG